MLKQYRSTGATKLADTKAVKLGKSIYLPANRGKFRDISPIGDGNCGLGTLALWLIDQILQKHPFQFNDDYEKRLVATILASLPTLKDRIALYYNEKTAFVSGNSFTDLIVPLNKFINFLENNSSTLTFQNIEEYILTNATSRKEIAAIQVGLASGLRALGCDLYHDFLQSEVKKLDAESEIDIANLREDGRSSGQELLGGLAKKVFNLNVHIFQENVIRDEKGSERHELITIHKSNDIQDAPVLNILNIGNNHWNYFIPAEQEGGLAACLPRISSNDSNFSISTASFFRGPNAKHSRIVEGKWTTERESDLLKESKKELIEEANAILIRAMNNCSIADENGHIDQTRFAALFDSLEDAIHISKSLNELLPKCKELLIAKRSLYSEEVISSLEKFIEAQEAQRFSPTLSPSR